MKNFENVKTAIVIFVNDKRFKSHAKMYDDETGFSFINEDELVVCGYEDTTIEKMVEDLELSISGLNDNFQREPYDIKKLYTHWELCSGITSNGKSKNAKITFMKGENPKIEYSQVTTTSHHIARTIKDYIHYNS